MAIKHNLLTGGDSSVPTVKHSLTYSMQTASKYSVVPNPLGPEFKNTDRRVWESRVYRSIKQLVLYQTSLQTNPNILGAIGGSGSQTLAGGTTQANTVWDGAQKPLKYVDGVESSGDFTLTSTSSGLTLSVDTGSGTKQYRLKLRWNASVSRPQMYLEEV